MYFDRWKSNSVYCGEVEAREVTGEEVCNDAEMEVTTDDGKRYCIVKESVFDE